MLTPFTGAEKPESSPSANGLRPLSGRSTIFLLSITWPSDEVDAVQQRRRVGHFDRLLHHARLHA